jgi:predicted Zn-dependent protease with MMP-like domain
MITISHREFDQAVEQALDEIPDEFRPHLDNVLIEVQARPAPAFMREHDVPDDILGIYVGIPLEDKGAELAPSPLPDRIIIFRNNLCEMCASLDELIDEIRITVLHEIGHHFGMDEDQLEDLGYD